MRTGISKHRRHQTLVNHARTRGAGPGNSFYRRLRAAVSAYPLPCNGRPVPVARHAVRRHAPIAATGMGAREGPHFGPRISDGEGLGLRTPSGISSSPTKNFAKMLRDGSKDVVAGYASCHWCSKSHTFSRLRVAVSYANRLQVSLMTRYGHLTQNGSFHPLAHARGRKRSAPWQLGFWAGAHSGAPAILPTDGCRQA